jgi:hypothetical protein
MTAAVRLALFGLVLATVFAAAAALGRAVGPLERGASDANAHGEMRNAEPGTALPGLAVAADGLRLEADRTTLRRGRRATFSFRILRRSRSVRAFDVEHERRMHLIVARRDLTEFRHLHPRMRADGTWTATLRLDRPGVYRAFADFSTGGRRTTLGVDVFVPGRWSPRPLPPPAPAVATGPYRVVLRPHDIAGGSTAVLRFDVSRGGRAIRPQPYLGALGHLVILREGDLAYLHAHADDDTLRFETAYPSAGRHRLFLQFAHAGRVHTAELTEWPQ